MVGVMGFAANAVVESIFTDGTQFDWTEYAAVVITSIIIYFKSKKRNV